MVLTTRPEEYADDQTEHDGVSRSGQSIGILILPTLRVPAALPLLADEAGVYTIPLANQTRPLAVLIECLARLRTRLF